ncbi:MAG: RNA polymerase subunit sigma-24, partial [Clostridia bacterium]|nr:RNA polymerase subunit sigma-24 [Clostridia bacterium]
WLFTAINGLGEPDREIVVRKYFLNEPSKSIAKRLDMSVSAVDTRTHRALKKLKKLLGGQEP